MSNWDYNEAFSRNRGLISPTEQEKLRTSRVAIAGMGGVGGFHAITLARLGVGKFNISDMDTFETGNFNRQIGAVVSTLGQKKAAVLERMIKDINPEAEVNVFPDGINEGNVDRFLDGADIFVDGFDFFVFDIRRLVFSKARAKGIYALTAAPVGFGATGIVFHPQGMPFDDYFNISDDLSYEERIASFLMGLTPKALHLGYADMTALNMKEHRGPSSTVGCEMASSFVGAQTVGILLGRMKIRCAPFCLQMDMYTGGKNYAAGTKRGFLRKLKRDAFARYFEKQLGTVKSNGMYERFLDWAVERAIRKGGGGG